MYRYKFIELEAKTGLSFYFEGYEDIIEENAADGWRFVTSIPTKTQGTGLLSTLSLVFEKNIED